MSGIYIHIPFCKQACTYCDFHFSTNQQLRKPLVEAICKEIEARAGEVKSPIQTIYFGGGSPSILHEGELTLIIETLNASFDLDQVQEFTLESNPDDHTKEKLGTWKNLGVDRLSIGIQSFIDRDLKMMNRAHSSDEALQCVNNAREAGFKKLTIDLIFGIPGQSLDEWKQNVDTAISLNTEHLSAYALSVEERTALAHQVAKGIIAEKDDEQMEREYLFLHDRMLDAGFEHYEISNYSLPESGAVHNASYWSGEPYLGIGPSAHSFDGKNTRRWNVSNNPAYIKALNSDSEYFETEILSEQDRSNEQIMTGLRTAKGIETSVIANKSLISLPSEIRSMLAITESSVRIQPEHWLMSDAIIRELIE